MMLFRSDRTPVRCFLRAAAVLVLAAGAGLSSDLDDYWARIHQADSLASQLIADASGTAATDEQRRAAAVELRRLVPVREAVTWPAGEVETDFTWLHDDLDAYVRERDPAARATIARRIGERLSAISDSLDTLAGGDNVPSAADDDKRKLNEILGREEYLRPADKEESLFQRWWSEFVNWIRRNFPSVGISPAASSGLSGFSFALQIILYALLAAGVGFLVYRLVVRMPRIRRRGKGGYDGERVILGELLNDDISSFDLFDEAEQCARRGELRMAIRKGYMALLCELADRGVIGLARNKTNRDYLRDVRKRRSLSSDFERLTLNFETHWYGAYPSDETAWAAFRDSCRELLKKRGND